MATSCWMLLASLALCRPPLGDTSPPDLQRQALVAVYEAAQGPATWAALVGNESVGVCSWPRVECDGGLVTSL